MVCNAKLPLGLYVHIPWCERKCPYCDFNSHEGFDVSVEPRYVDALLNDLGSQLPWAEQRQLVSVFIGGGTPSLFSDRSIGRLLDGIDQRLGLGAGVEVTLESNPGSAEAGRYAGYRAAGVNRLSVGVQSFSDPLLKRLGRVHDRQQALNAIALAREAGFDRYNIDLMHGLPDQTPEAAREDLATAIALSGGHVSWYQLTIEPNTVFYRDPPLLPIEDALAAIQEAGEAQLRDAGFEHYEVSAYATPGQASQHNLNYWEFGDYLGIGAGAHGKVSDKSGVWRFQRTRAPRDYLQALGVASAPERRRIGEDTLTGEFMMNALRLREGVPRSWFRQRTGLAEDAIAETVDHCIQRGLMINSNDRLATTALGFRFLNDVVGCFL